MIDIITYIPDLTAFRFEAQQNAENGVLGFNFIDGKVEYNITKIPVAYKGLSSVCLVRLVSVDEIDVFNKMESCEKIGVCENNRYIFDDGGQDKYESVHDISDRKVKNGDGETITIKTPYMIGVFS